MINNRCKFCIYIGKDCNTLACRVDQVKFEFESLLFFILKELKVDKLAEKLSNILRW